MTAIVAMASATWRMNVALSMDIVVPRLNIATFLRKLKHSRSILEEHAGKASVVMVFAPLLMNAAPFMDIVAPPPSTAAITTLQ